MSGSPRFLMLLAFIALSYSFANAQSDASSSRPSTPGDGSRLLANAEEEMRVRREIEFADKAHKENVARARDLAALTASLADTLNEKRSFANGDLKKLEKAEKLAKRIRGAAGGEEDGVETAKPPADLASAMNRLLELTASLKEKVEKTPKRVISTAIIDESNTILELIRAIRGMQPKA